MRVLPDTVLKQIDHWLAKYPVDQRQSALLPALTIVQDFNGGWLSNDLIDATAEYLQIPHIAAYEVVTFYSMFETKPVGKYTLNLCTNISCMLSGSEELAAYLKKRLGIEFGETTADGLFTLKSVECLGACANAPVINCAKKYYENLTPEKADVLLEELEKT